MKISVKLKNLNIYQCNTEFTWLNVHVSYVRSVIYYLNVYVCPQHYTYVLEYHGQKQKGKFQKNYIKFENKFILNVDFPV